ncbi:MAG: hypothetical protein ACFCU4_09650 [Puniceicoccaceae bacterium]
MTESHDKEVDKPEPSLDLSALQDFSFGPDWGTGAASSKPKERRAEPAERRPERQGGRRERPDRRQLNRGAGGVSRERQGGESRGEGPRGGYRHEPPFEPVVKVDFYPEDEPFEILMKSFKASMRTYELFELARIFLDKPDRFVVVVEPKVEGDRYLYLSLPSRTPFLTEAEALEDALTGEIARQYETFEVEVDPPKGNFQMVHRCGVTGKLIGPPNYHKYQSLLKEHHEKEIFGMSFEAMRNKLVSEKDPGVIEAWLKSQSTETRYREKPPQVDVVEEEATSEAGETTPAEAGPEEAEPAGIRDAREEGAVAETIPAPGAEASAEETPAGDGEKTSGAGEEGTTEQEPGTETVGDAKPEEAIKSEGEKEAQTVSAEVEDPAVADAAEAGGEDPAVVAPFEAMEFATLQDLTTFLRRERRDKLVKQVKKVRLPGKQLEGLADGPLRKSIEAEWNNQKRFPLQTSNNLRGKLRKANCHVYKRGKKGISFACAVRRKLRDPQAIWADSVQRLITFLEANPGIKISEVPNKLLGIPRGEEAALRTAEEIEAGDKQLRILSRDLTWMKSEGYLSEFSDGSLVLQSVDHEGSQSVDNMGHDSEPVYSTEPSVRRPRRKEAESEVARQEDSAERVPQAEDTRVEEDQAEPDTEQASEPLHGTEPAAKKIEVAGEIGEPDTEPGFDTEKDDGFEPKEMAETENPESRKEGKAEQSQHSEVTEASDPGDQPKSEREGD